MAKDRSKRVRERAYRLWEEAGRPEGRALDHWLEAEGELRKPGARSGRAAEETPAPARVRRKTTRSVKTSARSASEKSRPRRRPGAR